MSNEESLGKRIVKEVKKSFDAIMDSGKEDDYRSKPIRLSRDGNDVETKPKFFPEPTALTSVIPQFPTTETPSTTEERNILEQLKKYTTQVLKIAQSVIGTYTIINKKGEGAISEVVLLSDSTLPTNKAYKVQIIADGNEIYNGTWTEFSAISAYLSDMSCFDDGTYYVLAFQDIFYKEDIFIQIQQSTAIFSMIYMKKIERA